MRRRNWTSTGPARRHTGEETAERVMGSRQINGLAALGALIDQKKLADYQALERQDDIEGWGL